MIIIFIITIAIIISIPTWRKRYLYSRWRNQPQIQNAHNAIQFIYKDINPTAIAIAERKRMNNDSFSMVYGEIEFYAFAQLLQLAEPKPGEIFYDLGSGSGKAVFAADLLYDLQKCCGIEILPALVQLSRECLNSLQQHINSNEYYGDKQFNIEFVEADFMKHDISEADIVFVNATGFFGDELSALEQQLKSLKAGSRIIVSSKALESDSFELLATRQTLMSWGVSVCRVYETIVIKT